MSDIDPIDAELEQLRTAKAERTKARALERKKFELEWLKLEAKFEAELGPMGQKFELIDCTDIGCGIVAVKRGETVVYKRFVTTKEKDEKAIEEYVLPCIVHPTPAEFQAIINTQAPEVLGRCATAVHRLFGAKSDDDRGKF